MKKRILGVILAMCMLMTFVPCMASTETSGTCGDNVTWTLDNDGVLTVTGTGTIKTTPWSTHQSKILKVVIGEGIENIPRAAFLHCINLCEVTLPDSLKKIDTNAFSSTPQIKKINIPKNVEYIGYFAFRYNKFSEITVDDQNKFFKSINGSLYSKDGATLICYASGKNDEAYVSPDGVTTISRGAMYGAKNLKTITLSDDVIEVGINAFSNTPLLEEISIGANVNKIGGLAIYASKNLTNINVNENNQYFCDVDGILFNKSKTELITYPQAKSDTVYNIPEGTETIIDYAFHCDLLNKITIPQSVNTVYGKTFYFCDNLTSIDVNENNSYYCTVDGDLYTKNKTTFCRYAMGKNDESFTIPSYVNTIGDSAFCGCRNLNNIIIPETVTSIETGAFEDNTFTEITLPSSITAIPVTSFIYCHNLERVNLPKSIKYIANSAFEECESLSDVYYAGSEAEWNEISIDQGNECLTNATIHYNENNISEPAISEATVTASNGEYTFNISIDNVPQGSQLLTVVYNNGAMKGFAPTTITSADNGTTKSVTVSADSADSAKIFIWSDINNMKPLCENKTIEKNAFITQ